MDGALWLWVTGSALLGGLTGLSAFFLLFLIPEFWLRESWEEPGKRLSPSKREGFFLVLAGGLYLAASLVLSSEGEGNLLSRMIFFFLLSGIAYGDRKRMIIMDQYLLVLILFAFVFLWTEDRFGSPPFGFSPETMPAALSGPEQTGTSIPATLKAAGYMFLLSFLLAFPSFFGKTSPIGLGDAKLFTVLSLWTSVFHPEESPVYGGLSLFFLSFLLNGLSACLLLLTGKGGGRTVLPMAPAIVFAALVLSLPGR